MNTHYAVITFSGDPDGEHEDEELCGRGPHLDFIACGPEDFCWAAISEWTERHSLQKWQEVEVLARDRVSVAREGGA